MNHGGRRKNAGRKPIGKKHRKGIFVKLDIETIKKINRKRGKMSVGVYLDKLVKEAS